MLITRRLDIEGCYAISDVGIRSIARCKLLSDLNISYCGKVSTYVICCEYKQNIEPSLVPEFTLY